MEGQKEGVVGKQCNVAGWQNERRWLSKNVSYTTKRLPPNCSLPLSFPLPSPSLSSLPPSSPPWPLPGALAPSSSLPLSPSAFLLSSCRLPYRALRPTPASARTNGQRATLYVRGCECRCL